MQFLDNTLYAKPNRPTEIDLTSLINIIFLMLIFFMLAAAIAPADDAEIEPIVSSYDAQPADNSRVSITINRNAAITVDGDLIDSERFKSRLVELTQNNEQVELSIKADAKLEASVLVKLLADATDAGISSVAILTVRR